MIKLNSSLFETNKQQKKLMRWIVINLGSVVAFLVGTIYGIPTLENLALLLFWMAAIGGTVIGIGMLIASDTMEKGRLKLYVEPEENLPDPKNKEKETVYMKEESVYNLTHMSVPKWVDTIFDFGVVIMLSYFDYAWLPIMYLMHLAALVYIRDMFEKIYANIESYRIPVTTITEDDLDIVDQNMRTP